MKTYKNQAAFDADVIDGLFSINDDVTFNFDLTTTASITALNIKALDINARDINARDIDAWNIDAWNIDADNITALNIKAWNIDAWNITAWDIDAWNIDARDINARNIDAQDISFYACAYAHEKFTCKSIVGLRENSKFLCLDSEIIFKEKKA